MTHCNENNRISDELMKNCFVLNDVILYLDTHPHDMNALEYYRRKQQKLFEAKAAYLSAIGPVTPYEVDTSCGTWQWVSDPWPWQL